MEQALPVTRWRAPLLPGTQPATTQRSRRRKGLDPFAAELFGFAYMLERRRTQLLQATLESTADGILVIANGWSAWLAWLVTRRYTARIFQRALSVVWFMAALAVVDSAWWLMFWGWASK